VRVTAYSLPAFDRRPFWTIEYEEWEERHAHEFGTAKEERAQFWILSFFTVRGMEEPN
jgi:hypothetical protein